MPCLWILSSFTFWMMDSKITPETNKEFKHSMTSPSFFTDTEFLRSFEFYSGIVGHGRCLLSTQNAPVTPPKQTKIVQRIHITLSFFCIQHHIQYSNSYSDSDFISLINKLQITFLDLPAFVACSA